MKHIKIYENFDKFYYHITKHTNLQNIIDNGIKQNNGNNGIGVYLSDTIDKCITWRDIMIEENIENGNNIYNGDWYIIVIKNLNTEYLNKYDYYDTDFDISVGNEPKTFIIDEFKYEQNIPKENIIKYIKSEKYNFVNENFEFDENDFDFEEEEEEVDYTNYITEYKDDTNKHGGHITGKIYYINFTSTSNLKKFLYMLENDGYGLIDDGGDTVIIWSDNQYSVSGIGDFSHMDNDGYEVINGDNLIF